MFDDDILTGASIDDLLAAPSASGGGDILTGWGGDILTGADLDDELRGLTSLSTGLAVGGGDILTGASIDDMLDEISTGAPMSQAMLRQRLQQALLRAQKSGAQKGAALVAKRIQAQIAQKKAQEQAQMAKFGAKAVVTPEGDGKYRKLPLPVDSETNILANQTRTIRVQPQLRAKPKHFVVANPEWWRIRNIFVGNKPQFLANGGIPGIVFANDTIGVELIGDTAKDGQEISVEVENITGADHRFEGALICHAID